MCNDNAFVERNFHVLNDDRFIMEKISLPIEQQEGEDIHTAINRTRETIISNFKAAHPYIEEQLNFHVVRQVNNKAATTTSINGDSEFHKPYVAGETYTGTPMTKKSIEEQIEECTSIEELKTFKIISDMNPKLRELYHLKFEQLDRIEIQLMNK